MARNTLIQVRRGTTVQWSEANSVLSAGEWGYDTTTKRYKIGDGVTAWNSLAYASMLPTSDDLVGTSGIGINFSAISGTPVTVSVTGIQSSQVNDFNSAVSGLLPVKSIIAGNNITVAPSGDNGFVINSTLGTEEVQDAIGTYVSGVSGISVNYNDTTGYTTISLTDPTVQLSDITDLSASAKTFLDTPSSLNLASLVSDETGSGSLVFASGATLTNTILSGSVTIGSDSLSETIDDRVYNLLTTGSGIGLNYNDNSNILAVSVTGIPTSLITNFASGVNALIENAVSTTIVGNSGIGIVYDSGNNTLTISVTGIPHTRVQGLGTMSTQDASNVNITNGSINVSGLTVDNTRVSLSGHTHSSSDITNFNESVDDRVAALLQPGDGGITFNYEDDNVFNDNLYIGISPHINPISSITSSGTGAGTLTFNAANISATGNLTVGGNLIVQGTTTTVNSTIVDIGDNIITVNTSGLPEGGFRVFMGGDPLVASNYKGLIWNNTVGQWEFSGPKVVTTGVMVANSIEVTSTGVVTNLNSDKLDGQDGSYYLDWTNTTNKPTITGILTGDVAGTGSVTLDAAGGTVSISATIQPNSVALGTDTTGQYASTVSVVGTGLSINSANADDGTAYTVTSNATSANVTSTVVARDSSGNFSAGDISASQFIGGGSGLTNLNASNVSSGTLNSDRLPSVSQTNTTAGPSGSFVSSVSVDSYGRVTGVNTTTHTVATTSTQGVASFDSNDFSVTSGVVSIKTGGVDNSQLANSSITLGSSAVSLGGTLTSVSGLTSVSSTNFVGDLSGTSTNSLNIEVDVATSGTNNLVFVNGTDGNLKPVVNDKLRINLTNNELLGSSTTTPTLTLKYFIIDGGTP